MGREQPSWAGLTVTAGPHACHSPQHAHSLDIGAAGTASTLIALGQGQRAGLGHQLSPCPCMVRAHSLHSDLCVLLGPRTPAALGEPQRVGPKPVCEGNLLLNLNYVWGSSGLLEMAGPPAPAGKMERCLSAFPCCPSNCP